eukprot:g8002.t1
MPKRKESKRDKYFNLAKAQGYRARSAFKLIQLNKKFDFLSTASVCIDLCAAPGGWCQVAQKCMPAMSTIIGIDLLPIRPMRGVKTFQCDITTPLCRTLIKRECKGRKQCVDVVLCDGAPNVGFNYTKDAYVQNELALIALKLAVDVLKPGGWFVSKVFRSQDYNSLLWVFKQLFQRVQANKPLSSRNESAEIFVVCEGFFAPDKLDPRLLDAKHVFQQVEAPTKAVNIFHKKFGEQKRHRQGYDDDLGPDLTRKRSALEFVRAKDPIAVLSTVHRLTFDELGCEELLGHPGTTEEIKAVCADLRVVGKSEFKSLLKWRDVLLGSIFKEEEPEEEAEEAPKPALTAEQQEQLAERQLDRDLADLRDSEAAKKRREKKKEARKRAKQRERVALGMDQAGGSIDAEQEGVFSIAAAIGSGERARSLRCRALSMMQKPLGAMSDAAMEISERGAEEAEWADAGEAGGVEALAEGLDGDADEQLDAMYTLYNERKGGASKALKRQTKRSHVAQAAAMGDALMTQTALQDSDMTRYLEQLGSGTQKHKPDERDHEEGGADDDSEDEDSSSSEEEDGAEEQGYGAHGRAAAAAAAGGRASAGARAGERTALEQERAAEGAGEVQASRWIGSHPMLAEIDDEEEDRMVTAALGGDGGGEYEGDGSGDDDSDDDDKDGKVTGIAAEVLAQMPKTDKQKRHEARVKLMAR